MRTELDVRTYARDLERHLTPTRRPDAPDPDEGAAALLP